MRYLYVFWFLAILIACAKDDKVNSQPRDTTEVYRYLALGDSYTIGTAIGVDSSYAALLRDSLRASSPDSIFYQVVARNGWTTADLQQGIAAVKPDSSFDIVTLLIGVNNQYQGRSISEYEKEFMQLLEHGIALANGNKESVLVLSIPDWGMSPAGGASRAQISEEIDDFNAAQKAICDSLGVRFFDITVMSREALNRSSLIAKDGLHFSREMHQIWMREIYPIWYAKLQGA